MPAFDMPGEFVFRKSSYSGASGCVEVGQPAAGGSHIVVRNSRRGVDQQLVFTAAEWHAFVLGVKNGEFDVAAPPPEPV